MGDRDFVDQLGGNGLATVEILYRLPDYPSVLQSFIWQFYDEHPGFPRLKRFLNYWAVNIDAEFHTVTVTHKNLISPVELKFVEREFRLR